MDSIGQFLIPDASALLRILIVGIFAYAGLVLILRISGKRTLSQWNAFDLIVTVSLGSSLATAILSKDVTLVEGLAGFTILILAQYLVTYFSVRNKEVRKAVKSEPKLLLLRGRFMEEAMRKERVTRTEILSALRQNGIADLSDAGAVILETGGEFSVIRSSELGENSALSDVSGIQ